MPIVFLALAIVCISFVIFVILLWKDKKSVHKKKGLSASSLTIVADDGSLPVLSDIKISHDLLKDFLPIMREHIVGMDTLLHGLLVSLLAGGHVLIEGAPGLAKTKTVHTFADMLGLQFTRIQFTPDMLPSDLLGVEIYNEATKSFDVKLGPLVTQIVLADEINRTTPKVQSALLEAMQERQISLGGITHALPKPFMVLATQNPLEQEGTYPLPEAQIDRFLCKFFVDFPTQEQEQNILTLLEGEKPLRKKDSLFSLAGLKRMQKQVQDVVLDAPIKHLITSIVGATRDDRYADYIQYGASPRGSIALMQATKALAYIQNKQKVTKEDVYRLVLPTLRHRIIITYQARRSGISADDILYTILDDVS